MGRAVRNVIKIAAVAVSLAFGGYQIAFAILSNEYSSHQRRKAARRARADMEASLRDNVILAAGTDIVRSRVYGRKRNVDALVFQGSHGPLKQYLTWVVAVAGHEVDAIEGVFFDETLLTVGDGLDSDGAGGFWVTAEPWQLYRRESGTFPIALPPGDSSFVLPYTPVVGSVVVSVETLVGDQLDTVTWPAVVVDSTVSVSGIPGDSSSAIVNYQHDVLYPKARVWMHTGAPGQDLSSFLGARFVEIQSSDRFEGMALVVIEWEYDQDAFPSGLPQVSALLRGAKVLDTRTGVIAWTENPALIARDWALYANGGGCSAAEVNDGAIEAAANACDVDTEFTTPSGVETRPLYQCGIACKLDGNPDDWMDEIIESMAGKWAWSGGRIAMTAGVYRAPVMTITEDWVIGDVDMVQQTADADLVNSYRATIADSAQGWKVVPLTPVAVDSYVEADGQELPREITLGGVSHAVHAQHIVGVLMRDLRAGDTMRLPCSMQAWQLELFDVVTLSLPYFGISSQQYEIVGWEHSIDSPVVLTLKRISADIFDPDALFAQVLSSENTSLPLPWFIAPMSGLVAASGTEHLFAQADGSVVTRVWVTWDAIQDQSILQSGKVEVRFGPPDVPINEWQTIEVPGYATGAYLTGVPDGSVLIISARAVNTLRVRGPWAPQIGHTVIGKTAPPPDVANLTVIEQPNLGRTYFWDYPNPPLDLQGFEVRYSAGLTVYAWDAMVPLLEASKLERSRAASIPGDGEWTFAIRAVDTTGNMSVNPRYRSALFDQGSFGFPITSVAAEAMGWPGVKVNAEIDGYILADVGADTWDTIPNTWDAWLTWDGVSNGVISYTHPTIDLGASIDFRIRASSVAAGSTVTEYQSSDDDITYTAWAEVPADEITARYIRVRWTVTGSSPALYRAGFTLYA